MACNNGDALVGMGMVLVVLDTPRFERINERHETDGSNDIFKQFVFAERAMPAVVPNNKELRIHLKRERIKEFGEHN